MNAINEASRARAKFLKIPASWALKRPFSTSIVEKLGFQDFEGGQSLYLNYLMPQVLLLIIKKPWKWLLYAEQRPVLELPLTLIQKSIEKKMFQITAFLILYAKDWSGIKTKLLNTIQLILKGILLHHMTNAPWWKVYIACCTSFYWCIHNEGCIDLSMRRSSAA